MTIDTTEQQMKLFEDLMTRFQRALHAQSTSHAFGLTPSQVFILRHLSRCPHAKASDIARVSALSPGAVTQVCDELVRLNYVERARSNDDRRVVNVTITDKGREKFESILKMRNERARNILEELGPDASEFIRIVGRVVEIVEKESQEKR